MIQRMLVQVNGVFQVFKLGVLSFELPVHYGSKLLEEVAHSTEHVVGVGVEFFQELFVEVTNKIS